MTKRKRKEERAGYAIPLGPWYVTDSRPVATTSVSSKLFVGDDADEDDAGVGGRTYDEGYRIGYRDGWRDRGDE